MINNKTKKNWHRPKVTELDMMNQTLNGSKEQNKENSKHKGRS